TLLLLHRLGLAWDFRLPQDLPARAELQSIDRLGDAALVPVRHDLRAPRFVAYLAALRAKPAKLRMEWPAGSLALKPMRALVGDQVELAVDPTLDLLVVQDGRNSFVGLPAVCLAMAQRGPRAWIVAFLLMPVAVALEAIRASMSLKPRMA